MDNGLIKNGQYNIGSICTRLQCDEGKAEKIAMRWISADMQQKEFSFLDLENESNRFANLLINLGLKPGSVFFTFLPKMPEQFIAFLGALKIQAITGTLFSNFGKEALLDRLGDADAEVILTKISLLKKLQPIKKFLPALKCIIVADATEHLAPDVLSYSRLMSETSPQFEANRTSPETPSVLHYTSGSTGKPKGVLHTHRSVLSQNKTTRDVLQLHESDIFWCTADQGWVTGTSYGIIGPWSIGTTQVHYGGGYDAKAWFSLMEQQAVTVWYSAPTALRMLMREDPGQLGSFNLEKLKHIFSVGEPLNPEVLRWVRRNLDKEVYDTWFQTETGSIMISNRPGLAVKPGSMGKPIEGIEPAIVDNNGKYLSPHQPGHLCIKTDWPSMFVNYLNNDETYQAKFKNGYYYSGDTAYRDEDGYYWFQGRSDDVINTAGHLVSPFEVESILLEFDEVAESGVIGVPDELLYEKVVAYVALHADQTPSCDLEMKMKIKVANHVSTTATPQEIIFTSNIPKNRSGKIMRRVLKAHYQGTDAGDTSTLEI